MQPYIVNESKAKYGYSIHYEELEGWNNPNVTNMELVVFLTKIIIYSFVVK